MSHSNEMSYGEVRCTLLTVILDSMDTVNNTGSNCKPAES